MVIFAAPSPPLALWIRHSRLSASRPGVLAMVCAWILMTLLGLVIEILQSLSGHDASWSDLRADALGAAAGLLALAAWQQRQRRRPVAWLAATACCALLAVGCASLWRQLATQLEARRAMPVLLGDTTPHFC